MGSPRENDLYGLHIEEYLFYVNFILYVVIFYLKYNKTISLSQRKVI